MKVFISWSGQLSHSVATLLRDWLPNVLQAVEPWLSSQDIAPGERWFEAVSSQLAAVEVGIICLTAENANSKWLNFEAGAISKSQRAARICIFAVDLSPRDVDGPLAQFQVVRPTREDLLRLVQSLNDALGKAAMSDERLRRSFQTWWPIFTAQFEPLLEQKAAAALPKNTLDHKLDEALILLREITSISKTSEDRGTPPPASFKRPASERPRVFIGSSSEGLPVAEAIHLGLDQFAECTIWNQGVFALSSTTIESVVDRAAEFDFAVLVLTPDDTTTQRGITTPVARDNLIFELGLFTGILGRARTFLVHPRGASLHLPSDVAGVTAATYSQRSDRNMEAALGPVCTRIKRAMGIA